MDDRFPYETCQWGEDAAQKKRWFEALEGTGPENVRAILAQTIVGARASISVGTESLNVGFAQERLAWHDRRKMERETTFRSNQVFWTRWAALSATVAALAAAIGWAVTIINQKPH